VRCAEIDLGEGRVTAEDRACAEDRRHSASTPRCRPAQEALNASNEQEQMTSILPDALSIRLKSAYGALLNAPVPDKILDLVKKLEAGERQDPSEMERAASSPGGEDRH
jgi:hypothetical protein